MLSVVNAKLATLPPVHLRDKCHKVEDGQSCRPRKVPCGGAPREITTSSDLQPLWCYEEICHPLYRDVCTPVMGSLTSTGVFSKETEATVNVKEPNWDDIPISYFGLKASYFNCNPLNQEFTFTQTNKLSIGTKLTKTKTIKSGQEISASVGFEFIVKGNVAAKFSREISVGSTEEASELRDETFSYTEKVNVPGMHLLTYTHEFAQKAVDIHYTGTVQVDGTLQPNAAKIKTLVQALPQPADRTFDFAGFVTSTDVYEGRTKNIATKITEEECSKIDQPVVLEPYVRVEN
ncbi:hypothetical protein [Sinorhizobium meliloti]|uniref:hypothetical protein n=1 Tax=Rhizobium meliloti TaxID=382 RepID=UPI001AEEE1C4|nr:hypothetical protein [Sinorhizobium meliloti]